MRAHGRVLLGCGVEATEVLVSKRKRPMVFEDPALYQTPADPAPLYPDVSPLGGLIGAVRAAAMSQGLDIPPRAFQPIGRDSVRPHWRYGLTVHSEKRNRESLRVTAMRRRREWRVEGGHGGHRIDGMVPELAEVARVVHAWHAGTDLADIGQVAPCVTVEAVDYRYFGVMRDNDESGEPSSVCRTWTDASGYDQEETFQDSLTWEKTDRMSRSARPTYDPDPVEIDIATVDRFIHRVTKHIRAELRRH
jgi:hypothetical protein